MARFGLPGISSKIPADLKQFLDRVREWMTDADRAMVAKQDLINAGLADVDRAGNVLPADPGAFSSIPPPVPLNVIANGAMTSILVEWDAPLYPNHAYAEIWASGLDDFGQAVLVGTSLGTMFSHAVGAGEVRYYWVRFISRASIVGPYNAVAGTPGETSNDPAWVLGVLEGQLTENQLYQDLTARIDLIDGTGVGSVNLRIADEALARANAILNESTEREAAIADEASARAQALLTEATARQNGDGALQTQINMLSAASTGDLGELLAALQEEQTARINGDAAEVTARETLATQVRGNYTGTDLAQVTTGLVYSERQARTTADTALATRATALEATVNSATDGNTALKARIATEEATRANADTAEATARTALAARVTTAEGNITTNAAAITAEQTARANADTALTSSVNTLSARLNSGGDVANAIVQSQTTANTAVTNAATAQTTANSKNKTYFQTAAPTSGMTAGDLWFDTDDSNKAYRYSGSAWVEAADARISSTASQVTTLQTTVSGHTTSIQTQQTSIDGVLGKYSVKVDNNGYVTGFGLISAANNGTPVSEFAIVADKFSIAPVATDPATANGSPFFYLTTPTVINGVTIPAGAYMKAAYIADASITNAKIANASIDNAKIVSLSADKLTAGSIAVDQAIQSSNFISGTTGWKIAGNGAAELSNAVIRGSVTAESGHIGGCEIKESSITSEDFDISAGWSISSLGVIKSRGHDANSNPLSHDYALISNGEVSLYRYITALDAQVLYKYLSRIESGQANNGSLVEIPGYWKAQPRVMVSPSSLALYKSAYANQDQSLQCLAEGLQETSSGTGVWRFTAKATLTLAANTVSVAVNVGSGDISANSWTSGTYTTPSNCTSISPALTVNSKRGNGASQWYYRSIRWRVEYLSGGAWVTTDSWSVVNIGAQFSGVTTDKTLVFPSAAAWQWRIYAEQYDTNGTLFGSIAYETSTYTTPTVAGPYSTTADCYSQNNRVLVVGLGSYSPPSGWTIQKVKYQYEFAHSVKIDGSSQYVSIDGPGVDLDYSGTREVGNYYGEFNNWTAISYEYATTSYVNSITLTIGGSSPLSTQWWGAKLGMRTAKAVITISRPVPNSTTPVNNTYINSYSYNLASAQVLATGSLNWMAVGE